MSKPLHEPRENHDRSAMCYEIRVEGILDEKWSAWFDNFEISRANETATMIAGWAADQAALHGLLSRINDLGLTLISVQRLEPEDEPSL